MVQISNLGRTGRLFEFRASGYKMYLTTIHNETSEGESISRKDWERINKLLLGNEYGVVHMYQIGGMSRIVIFSCMRWE